MIQYQIARKYSQALFSLASEQDKIVPFRDQINEVWNVINNHEDLHDAFFHPRILPADKKKIITRIFGEEMPDTILNFLYLLIDKRREYYLGAIINKFKEMVNEAENIIEVEVISAIPLSDKLKKKLQEKLAGLIDCEIIFTHREEPEIIGGLILKIGDYIIDGSIKNRINALNDKIREIPVSKLGV